MNHVSTDKAMSVHIHLVLSEVLEELLPFDNFVGVGQ